MMLTMLSLNYFPNNEDEIMFSGFYQEGKIKFFYRVSVSGTLYLKTSIGLIEDESFYCVEWKVFPSGEADVNSSKEFASVKELAIETFSENLNSTRNRIISAEMAIQRFWERTLEDTASNV